jgi:uncharacterized protein YbjT (DUF2867 family)
MPRYVFSALALACAIFFLSACATEGARNTGAPLLLVAGATGGTGQEVVERALQKGFRVRALVRDETAARTLFGNRVDYAVGDVRDPPTLRSAVRGVDYVVSALGSSGQRDPENRPELVDYKGVKALAEAASAAGVKHFVLVSSMGVTHPDHPLNRTLDNVLQWKLKGEEALRATGMPYTIVRPGILTNDSGEQSGIKAFQGDPLDAAAPISRADLATVLVNAIGREEARGTTFEIVGDATAPVTDWSRFFAQLRRDSV